MPEKLSHRVLMLLAASRGILLVGLLSSCLGQPGRHHPLGTVA